ncbi:MAG TPA: hypothetical protein DEG32_03500 [Balneolaceae bacterium]|nr:hypothetical protein [Balneolaceae bacterium]
MKKTLYWVITLLFPFLLLGLVEILLRISGYNEDAQSLFVEVPTQPEYVATNPAFVSRYFPSFRPQVAISPFLKEKEEDTFRVFVMGGSSTQGFPYNFYSSFSTQLEQRLLMEIKGLNIELVNLGMTAVNSFVIWDLSSRLVEYKPDAVIIYAGHNEYYGSFGVGSTQFGFGEGVGLKRLMLNLKNWRLYQFIEDIMRPEDTADSDNRTMMAKVVKDAEIGIESELFEAGISQFQENISDVLDRFENQSVPVFIGTVASNLKDQAPLGDNDEAISSFTKGVRLFEEGEVNSASDAFFQAKELDAIRFRAPEKINEVISTEAYEYGAEVVDVNSLAENKSRSTIPDSSFFVDHLHPDWEGHQAIADLFFEVMVNKLENIKAAYSPNILFERTSTTQFEKIYSTVPVDRLTSGYPFQKGLSEEAEYAGFQRLYDAHQARSYVDSIAATSWRMQRPVSLALTDVINYSSNQRDSLSVVKHYQQLAYWQIYNENLLKKGVAYAINSRKFDTYSAQLLHIILSIERDDPYFSNSLAALYLIHKDLDRAEEWLEESKALDEQSQLLWYNYARLYALRGDTTNARSAFEKYINIRNAQ